MAMKMKEASFGASKNILATFGDHVAIPAMHGVASADNPNLAVLVNGRWIVKAGTFYPSNDAKAVGLVFSDYDVTDGDAAMSILIAGTVKTAALPEHPSAAANSALKNIQFVPLSTSNYASKWEAFAPKEIAAGAAAGKVTLSLAQGVMFTSKVAAETVANWTLTASTTGISITSISLKSASQVEITLEGTTLAGTASIKPSAAIISNGQAPDNQNIVVVA